MNGVGRNMLQLAPFQGQLRLWHKIKQPAILGLPSAVSYRINVGPYLVATSNNNNVLTDFSTSPSTKSHRPNFLLNISTSPGLLYLDNLHDLFYEVHVYI